jgi:hypothetical protein
VDVPLSGAMDQSFCAPFHTKFESEAKSFIPQKNGSCLRESLIL